MSAPALGSAREAVAPRTRTGARPRRQSAAPPEGFDPLELMPRDLPPTRAARLRRLARVAHRQPLAAAEIKGIDCTGWERTEAARCHIRGCPLWGLNRRIFGREPAR